MKFTTNSAMAREYKVASKRMLEDGFEVIEPQKCRLTQADVRLGICEMWEEAYQSDFEPSGFED